jgi:sulfoxide reductase heme-binding subunit YedZ
MNRKNRMTTWFKKHWRWAALNVFALGTALYVLTQGTSWFRDTSGFDRMLESGKWALRFLLFCLAITPLNTYFGWRNGIPLRKPAGLWAFGFTVLHVALLLAEEDGYGWRIVSFPLQPVIVLGLAGLIILTLMAVTSNQRAMKWLGKRWKRLHRLVYAAGGIVIFHAILATYGKKVALGDPDAIYEINLYMVILIVLLGLRVPFVRGAIQQLKDTSVFPLRREDTG